MTDKPQFRFHEHDDLVYGPDGRSAFHEHDGIHEHEHYRGIAAVNYDRGLNLFDEWPKVFSR